MKLSSDDDLREMIVLEAKKFLLLLLLFLLFVKDRIAHTHTHRHIRGFTICRAIIYIQESC